MVATSDWRNRYAELLLAHAVNVPNGGLLGLVGADESFEGIVRDIAEKRSVEVVSFTPNSTPSEVAHFSERNGYLLRLLGKRSVVVPALRPFMAQAVKLEKHWCLAIYPDSEWAESLFPSDPQAVAKLEEMVVKTLLLDKSDPESRWSEVDQRLRRRAQLLNEAEISQLNIQAQGWQLNVGLSPKAVWKGGRKCFLDGTFGWTNFPCGEIFTTPDKRRTSGTVRFDIPFSFQGHAINQGILEFAEGRLLSASAQVGQEYLNALIETDEGARFVGEIALVGEDSPCGQFDFYNHTLPDEKRRGHLALGSGYSHCLSGYDRMTEQDFAEVGLNTSKVHSDLMWGTSHTTVTAQTKLGKREILTGFKWAEWLC
jgi:aminopeptidase